MADDQEMTDEEVELEVAKERAAAELILGSAFAELRLRLDQDLDALSLPELTEEMNACISAAHAALFAKRLIDEDL